MTYLQFHLVFTLPVLVVLALVHTRLDMPGTWRWLGTVVALAVAYTTPWDNYLVYRGVWAYPESAVIGTIGYVPLEEYAFFVIQTLIAGLFYLILRATGRLDAHEAPMPAWWRFGLVGAFLALAGLGVWLLLSSNDHALYMGLILAWAPPVIAGMLLVGARKVWDERLRVLIAITVVTVYLWMIDRVAIGIGIWDIAAPYRLHVDPLGLPLEEATFFTVTTTLCVFGLALFLPKASR